MTDNCKICLREIDEQSIEEHIAADHAGTPASVQEVYADRYNTIFDSNGELRPQYRDDSSDSDDEDSSLHITTSGTRSQNKSESHHNDSASSDTNSNTEGAHNLTQSTSNSTNQGSSGSTRSVNRGNGSNSTDTIEIRDDAGQNRLESESVNAISDEGVDNSVSVPGSTPLSGATGNKWQMIGVGGAGNHILDAILLRRETLREQNSPLAQVWDGGLADYAGLNTNIAELGNTFYAQQDRAFSREKLITNGMIGYRHHNYSGAGRNWKVGRTLMQKDFEDEKNAIKDRLDVDQRDLEASQAVMLIHSVTKGTGCGSTPVLAKNIRNLVSEGTGVADATTLSKPILSSVVLPSETEFGASEMVRGVVGMAYLSKHVDGIIPFDNSKLDAQRTDFAVDIDQAALEHYNPPMYTDVNRLLVTFLEAFTMSSTPQSADTTGTERISGEVFDVPDSFRPVQRKYSVASERAYTPAVVMAPVIGTTSASRFDRARLDTLARSTLLQGQLVDFDPKSAWGGTFMAYGPAEKMEELEPLLQDGELTSILSGQDFLAREQYDGPSSIDIYVNQLVVPHVDNVYLWGLIWNPNLPTLERMYKHARELVEQSENKEAQELREAWETIEPLFDCLGRENMG